MSITATELKLNFGKYLLLTAIQDVYSACNGKTVAKLVSPYQDHVDTTIDALFSSAPDTMTLEEAQQQA